MKVNPPMLEMHNEPVTFCSTTLKAVNMYLLTRLRSVLLIFTFEIGINSVVCLPEMNMSADKFQTQEQVVTVTQALSVTTCDLFEVSELSL